MIRTIVTDMDDTMLNENGELTPYTLSVLRECRRRGIDVVAVSGRTAPNIRVLVEQIGTGCPYIGANGAEIIGADHQMLRTFYLPVDLAREILTFLTPWKIYCHVYHGMAYIHEKGLKALDGYGHAKALHPEEVENLATFVDFETPKILVIAPEEDVARVTPPLRERFGDRVELTQSKTTYLEIMIPGVSKGNALKVLSGMTGIRPEETLAFGDGLNDISMLNFTPHSVAVANARPAVQAAASAVCASNREDGPAHYIAEHVLALAPGEVLP